MLRRGPLWRLVQIAAPGNPPLRTVGLPKVAALCVTHSTGSYLEDRFGGAKRNDNPAAYFALVPFRSFSSAVRFLKRYQLEGVLLMQKKVGECYIKRKGRQFDLHLQ